MFVLFAKTKYNVPNGQSKLFQVILTNILDFQILIGLTFFSHISVILTYRIRYDRLSSTIYQLCNLSC